jgi:hypothetical protein
MCRVETPVGIVAREEVGKAVGATAPVSVDADYEPPAFLPSRRVENPVPLV